MCGRFTASFDYRQIKVRWNLRGDFPLFGPRYNIAPSQDVPVIVRNEDRHQLKTMRWGLLPSWAQDPSIGQRMINARAEPCSKNRLSSSSLQRGDVLFPATASMNGDERECARCQCGFT